MGRSEPQITAKRQLLDCVTLTMVLLSLLFRPGKCRVLFQSVPLHSAACGAAILSRGKCLYFLPPNVVRMNLISVATKKVLEALPGGVLLGVFPVVLTGRKVADKLHVHSGAESCCCECPSLQPTAQLAEQHHFAHSTGVFFFLNTFQPFLFETSFNNTPLIPREPTFDRKPE